jgi:hypothetical protein
VRVIFCSNRSIQQYSSLVSRRYSQEASSRIRDLP